MRAVHWKVLNVLVLVAVLAANGAAGSGALSGESIGVIANRYRSLFLPANHVFGIWSLIYLALIASAVYQALPLAGATAAVERLGPWWAIAGVLNIAWVVLFSFSRFGAALLVMLVLLAALVAQAERVRAEAPPGSRWGHRLLVRWPAELYLAWISVALIANSFQFAHVTGFGGFGIGEATWSVVMMAVATALGATMAWTKGAWVFPLVVAWALHGIGVRYADSATLAGASRALVVTGLAACLATAVLRVRGAAGRPVASAR